MTTAMQKVKDMLDETPDHQPEPPRPLFGQPPEAEPYPIDALGPVLGPAARAIHRNIQAPLAICAHSVLAAAALAVQGHANIELPFGQTRPVSLYLLSVAESGERKSSVDTLALKPVNMREAALNHEYKAAEARYRNDKAIWDHSRSNALAGAKKQNEEARFTAADALEGLGAEPQPPLTPMLLFDDPTYEGLIKYMVNAHPSLGIFSAEGGQFIGGHGMKDENRIKTAAGMSSIWDGQPARRVRAGDTPLYLQGRRISMHLMVQPGVATTLLSDPVLEDQGLLSRLLVAAPATMAGTRMFRQHDLATDPDFLHYETRLLSILNKSPPLMEGTRNELVPRVLRLTPTARDMWICFHDKVEEQVGPDGPLHSVRAFANKLAEHAARLAGVMALVEGPECTGVDERIMERAIELAQHYLSEAIRLRLIAQVPQDLAAAQQLLGWMLHKWAEPFISIADIGQYGPNKLRLKKKAEPLVRILVEHGHLITQDGVVINGTRRKQAWRIIRKGE